MFALKVHREEIACGNLIKEYRGSTGKVAALSRVDRKHNDINLRIFTLYAVDNHFKVIFSLLHLALGRSVFPMPVIKVAGMKHRGPVTERDEEAYPFISGAESLYPDSTGKIFKHIALAHSRHADSLVKLLHHNIIGKHIDALMILGKIEYHRIKMVGVTMARKENHRKLLVMVQELFKSVGRVTEIIKYNYDLRSGNGKSAMVKISHFSHSIIVVFFRFFYRIYNIIGQQGVHML